MVGTVSMWCQELSSTGQSVSKLRQRPYEVLRIKDVLPKVEMTYLRGKAASPYLWGIGRIT